MISILVVDDDIHIRELIGLYMSNEGFTVHEAGNGIEALSILEAEKVDLAIIDVMMPKMDGWELTEEIRSYYDMPILMVTAKGESQDKIKGFRLGTDDYVVKPFDALELTARVRALLRRYQIQMNTTLSIGDLLLDKQGYTATKGEKSILLPLKEFELLFKLASTPNRIFTRNDLIEEIWGLHYQGDDRTVDVHIKRLRSKLDQLSSTLEIITVRGLGYKLEVSS